MFRSGLVDTKGVWPSFPVWSPLWLYASLVKNMIARLWFFSILLPVWSHFPHSFHRSCHLWQFVPYFNYSTWRAKLLVFRFSQSLGSNDYDFGKAVYWPVTWPLYKFAFTGNASMTVLLCVERFIVIIYPEKSKIWCSKKRTLLYICIATVISLILTIPHFFFFTLDSIGNVKPTDFAQWYVSLDVGADFLFRSILPAVTLITLSTIAAIKVIF